MSATDLDKAVKVLYRVAAFFLLVAILLIAVIAASIHWIALFVWLAIVCILLSVVSHSVAKDFKDKKRLEEIAK